MILPLIAGIVTLFGGIISAIGQNQKAQSNKRYNDFMASTADEQATEVRETSAIARRMITAGASRSSQKAAVTSKMALGAQRAAAAASGLGGGSVTAENLAIDEANKSVLDDIYIRFQADQQKAINERDELAQERGYARQAQAYRMAGDAAVAGGGWNTAGTMLGAASQAADIWYRA